MPQTASVFSSLPETAAPLPARPDERLDLIRREAARARTAPRLDFFRACSLLTLDAERAPIVFARALLRVLGQALGQRPVFHRAGSEATSFDEDWLMRLIDRLEAGDHDSVAFLLRRRVPHDYRRSVAFLLHGLVSRPDRAA
ncbi:hypothetical protein [Mangrovicoccus sp. HB161399]|uniref:hypothetical protein n=1 Tax=Mangrovicoccus sp. HB161399 TaxID=2720392 RepID=UPI00155664D0|nr:hypothetical protein [Mangrovicoccus sp. HB161399]